MYCISINQSTGLFVWQLKAGLKQVIEVTSFSIDMMFSVVISDCTKNHIGKIETASTKPTSGRALYCLCLRLRCMTALWGWDAWPLPHHTDYPSNCNRLTSNMRDRSGAVYHHPPAGCPNIGGARTLWMCSAATPYAQTWPRPPCRATSSE